MAAAALRATIPLLSDDGCDCICIADRTAQGYYSRHALEVCGWEGGRYYGSSFSHGRRSTFYLIDFHTVAVADRFYEPGSRTFSDVKEQEPMEQQPCFVIVLNTKRKKRKIMSLNDRYLLNQDRLLNIEIPGFLCMHSRVSSNSLNHHYFVIHAVVNAFAPPSQMLYV